MAGPAFLQRAAALAREVLLHARSEEVFEGEVKGTLVWPPRGDQGHGYDPMFLPDGLSETFGELERWKKNRMSHRSAAFSKLVEKCFT